MAFAKTISKSQLDDLYNEVYRRITSGRETQIESKAIGWNVVESLKRHAEYEDEEDRNNFKVAYLRFASVFLFKENPDQFLKEVEELFSIGR